MEAFYGNTKNVFHTVQIDSEHQGKEVYLRVSPYREGPTAYGMTMRRESLSYNFSSQLTPTGGYIFIEGAERTAVEYEYYKAVTAYIDAFIAQENSFPKDLTSRLHLGLGEYVDDFLQRYFEPDPDNPPYLGYSRLELDLYKVKAELFHNATQSK